MFRGWPAAASTNSQARFLPGGNEVLDVSSTGNGVIWNVNPSTWKARACEVAHRNLTGQEWTEYLENATYHQLRP
jgi:hypothetical protein